MSAAAAAAPAPGGKIARRYHRFGRLEIARLFVRYQAYAALLFTIAAAPTVLVAVLAPTRWWAWLIAVPITLKVGSFAVFVTTRWRAKLRVTAVAQRRIDAGRFSPEMVREMCGDPCFRSVSAEVLARSGMPTGARRALISRYRKEMKAENGQTLIIDHTRGTVLQVEGDRITHLTFGDGNPTAASAPPTNPLGHGPVLSRHEPMPRPGVS